jgi:hypothetical protein
MDSDGRMTGDGAILFLSPIFSRPIVAKELQVDPANQLSSILCAASVSIN